MSNIEEEVKELILCRQCEKPTDTPFGSCLKCRADNTNPNNPPFKKELQEGENICIGEPFKEGFDPRRNLAGRPPDTEQDKIIKKATKELIKEYKESLGEALPLIKPVLIAKALEGDMGAIKEIHDRVMDKSRQNLGIDGGEAGLAIQFAPVFNKNDQPE